MLFLKKKKMRDWQGTGMYRGAEAVPQNYFISKYILYQKNKKCLTIYQMHDIVR